MATQEVVAFIVSIAFAFGRYEVQAMLERKHQSKMEKKLDTLIKTVANNEPKG